MRKKNVGHRVDFDLLTGHLPIYKKQVLSGTAVCHKSCSQHNTSFLSELEMVSDFHKSLEKELKSVPVAKKSMWNGKWKWKLHSARKKFPEGATRRLWESQYSNKTKSCPPNFHCLTHWNIKQHFAAAVIQKKRTTMKVQNVEFPERDNKNRQHQEDTQFGCTSDEKGFSSTIKRKEQGSREFFCILRPQKWKKINKPMQKVFVSSVLSPTLL